MYYLIDLANLAWGGGFSLCQCSPVNIGISGRFSWKYQNFWSCFFMWFTWKSKIWFVRPNWIQTTTAKSMVRLTKVWLIDFLVWTRSYSILPFLKFWRFSSDGKIAPADHTIQRSSNSLSRYDSPKVRCSIFWFGYALGAVQTRL